MTQEDNYLHWAGLASGEYDFIGEYYEKVKIFNLQLRYWVEARNKFQKLSENNFILERSIINN